MATVWIERLQQPGLFYAVTVNIKELIEMKWEDKYFFGSVHQQTTKAFLSSSVCNCLSINWDRNGGNRRQKAISIYCEQDCSDIRKQFYCFLGNAVHIQQQPHPPEDSCVCLIIFRDFFKNFAKGNQLQPSVGRVESIPKDSIRCFSILWVWRTSWHTGIRVMRGLMWSFIYVTPSTHCIISYSE